MKKVPYGPYFKHIDEYIEAAKKHPDNVLILKYEDMKADPQKVISQIAKFLQVNPRRVDWEEVHRIVLSEKHHIYTHL